MAYLWVTWGLLSEDLDDEGPLSLRLVCPLALAVALSVAAWAMAARGTTFNRLFVGVTMMAGTAIGSAC